MKKLFITLAIAFISIVVFAQNDYYWSAGKKHYLKKEPGTFIVKFTGKEKIQDVQKELQKRQGIQSVTFLKNDLGIIIAGGGYYINT